MAHLRLNSQEIEPGDTFVALVGERTDGRLYIADAIQKGAQTIVVDEANPYSEPVHVPVQPIPHLKTQLGNYAARFYQNPSSHCQVVAITGTSGKTSVCQFLAQSLQAVGQKTATIGTLGAGVSQPIYTGLTTPDAVSVQRYLADFVSQNVSTVVLEATSHALVQGRLQGTHIETALFTNLSHDHLDYHHTMASYGQAKLSLFQWPGLKRAIVNLDDPFSLNVLAANQAPQVITTSLQKDSDAAVRVIESQCSGSGISALVATPWGVVRLQNHHLLGHINLSNLLLVLAFLGAEGQSIATIENALSAIQPIPGRLESFKVSAKTPLVVVDFAHKPDALAQVIATLKPMTQARLWCVVGCGGNRDAAKRPLMAKVGAQADVLILTSDNPRDEEPHAIIDQMQSGLDSPAHAIVDRKSAIEYALTHAAPEDTVLIAGRGNETHQIVKGRQIPFQDRQVAEAILKGVSL